MRPSNGRRRHGSNPWGLLVLALCFEEGGKRSIEE